MQLNIETIFKETISLIWVRKTILFRLGIPLLAGAVVVILSLLLLPSGFDQSAGFIPLMFGVVLLMLYLVLIATTGCYKVFLLERESLAQTSTIRWGTSETHYLGWSIALGLCLSILVGLPYLFLTGSFISVFFGEIFLGEMTGMTYLAAAKYYLLLFIWYLPILYISARWSLVLPAAAIGKTNLSLEWSWRLSRGNGMAVLFLIYVIPGIIGVFFGFVLNSISGYFPEVLILIFSLSEEMSGLGVAVLGIGMLSICYKQLETHQSEPEPSILMKSDSASDQSIPEEYENVAEPLVDPLETEFKLVETEGPSFGKQMLVLLVVCFVIVALIGFSFYLGNVLG